MAVRSSLYLIFAVFTLFLCSLTQGYKFYVGGRDGWVLNPSESYSHWAERNRFQVNDTLLFKHKKGEDSVLLVTKENYNNCNINNPIKSLTDENSEYKFERSGPHYFISGNSENCKKGQKIIIVVLAIRPKKTPPSPSPKPSPINPPATVPAVSPSPPGSDSGTPVPNPEAKKNSGGVVYGSPLLGVGLSVVIGVGVFLGGFGIIV
ncbi:early nodulin-like protein 3 [Silene latifolia]|uniref:early nodulin-like protein 3 n=1 Tax=Silene latifolia TaxID=37657 RepID=UPI003D78A54C